MNLKIASRVVGALATILLLNAIASATPVGAGTFNVGATVYVTNTSFLVGLQSVPSPGNDDQTADILLPTTGAFSSLHVNDIIGFKSLMTPGNTPPGPVVPGSPFVLPQFITVPQLGINLDLTALPISPVPTLCSASGTYAPGDICQAAAGSPITLEQGFDGVTAIFSLSGVAYTGTTADGTSKFSGKFSADFSNPPDNTINGLLTDFAANGFITTGFHAVFTTFASPAVPEPGSMAMALVGASLFGLGMLRKRRLAR
jgi:PEP-CTERM motif